MNDPKCNDVGRYLIPSVNKSFKSLDERYLINIARKMHIRSSYFCTNNPHWIVKVTNLSTNDSYISTKTTYDAIEKHKNSFDYLDQLICLHMKTITESGGKLTISFGNETPVNISLYKNECISVTEIC